MARGTKADMNVLLIGSGGREHALAWALAKSPRLRKLICAPGNAGISELADCRALDATDHAAMVALCRRERIDLVVVGPEAPLVAGLVDDLATAGIPAFGPTRAAAQLEGSKGFTKDLCAEAGIPTAAYARFRDAAPARAYIAGRRAPVVVKADGLAAGKGVVVAQSMDEALAAVDACFAGSFGAAGAEVVIEEFLEGEEASFFALVDGETALPLAGAQDHKRAFDGDSGPNTGGMGAYSPASILTPDIERRVMAEIIRPTVEAMTRRGTPYRGVLYAGLMLTTDGPKLIEYNARFGDPETQVLMLRLKSDLLDALQATTEGRLAGMEMVWSPEAAVTVVMASRGYPGAIERKGSAIRGLERASAVEGVQIFHAATGNDGGHLVATGGRVLNVSAKGRDVAEARARAYRAVDLIDWPEGFCRRDIGWRELSREP